MRKPVWVGAALGFFVMALVAGGVWVRGSLQPLVTAPDKEKITPSNSALFQGAEGMVQPSAGRAAAPPALLPPPPMLSPPSSSKNVTQERRRRLAEVRAEFDALRAQGIHASPEKLQAVVNELELISPPGIDPRYYQTLRNLINISGRVQTLDKEQQMLSQRTAPQDVARRQEILSEMQKLGAQAVTEARDLQLYVPTAPSRMAQP